MNKSDLSLSIHKGFARWPDSTQDYMDGKTEEQSAARDVRVGHCTRLQLLLCLSIVKTFEVYVPGKPRTFDRAHPVKIYWRICLGVSVRVIARASRDLLLPRGSPPSVWYLEGQLSAFSQRCFCLERWLCIVTVTLAELGWLLIWHSASRDRWRLNDLSLCLVWKWKYILFSGCWDEQSTGLRSTHSTHPYTSPAHLNCHNFYCMQMTYFVLLKNFTSFWVESLNSYLVILEVKNVSPS